MCNRPHTCDAGETRPKEAKLLKVPAFPQRCAKPCRKQAVSHTGPTSTSAVAGIGPRAAAFRSELNKALDQESLGQLYRLWDHWTSRDLSAVPLDTRESKVVRQRVVRIAREKLRHAVSQEHSGCLKEALKDADAVEDHWPYAVGVKSSLEYKAARIRQQEQEDLEEPQPQEELQIDEKALAAVVGVQEVKSSLEHKASMISRQEKEEPQSQEELQIDEQVLAADAGNHEEKESPTSPEGEHYDEVFFEDDEDCFLGTVSMTPEGKREHGEEEEETVEVEAAKEGQSELCEEEAVAEVTQEVEREYGEEAVEEAAKDGESEHGEGEQVEEKKSEDEEEQDKDTIQEKTEDKEDVQDDRASVDDCDRVSVHSHNV